MKQKMKRRNSKYLKGTMGDHIYMEEKGNWKDKKSKNQSGRKELRTVHVRRVGWQASY